MTIGIAVFSRFDSNRVPGKALLDIAGRPMLGRVTDRLRALPLPLVVASSDRAMDQPIVDFASSEGVPVFRGPVDDVMGRALGCARHFGWQALLRISGDSPFIDPAIIDQLVQNYHQQGDCDLVTNVFPRSFPPGQSAEIIRLDALQAVYDQVSDAADREHVTTYFYANSDRYRIRNVSAGQALPLISQAVDTAEDLGRARWVASRLPAKFGWLDVAALAAEWQGGGAKEGK